MTGPLEAALLYASLGWRVMPVHSIIGGRCSCNRSNCENPGKHPRIAKWQAKASTDTMIIGGWWKRWPDSNVGVATGQESGIIVLDVDPKHGGEESLLEIVTDNGQLLDTPVSLTGGGGRHYLFAHPGIEIRNSAGKLGPGLDTRGDGGYIVAPPSMHISGKAYEWEVSSDPSQVNLAPVPPWILDLTTFVPGKNGSGPTPIPNDRIPAGQRNQELTSLAGTMRRRGMSQAEILAALETVNKNRCDPPLAPDEVKKIAQSVGKYKSAPRKWPKSHEYVNFLKTQGYEFRLCELDDSLWVNDQRMTDTLDAKIRGVLRDNGYRLVNVAADAVLAHAGQNTFNPVKEFLEALTWDSQDHIDYLANYVVDKHGNFPLILRKWLIGAVARAFTGGRQNRVMVLDATQGVGKSYFVRWLASPMEEFFSEAAPDLENKDAYIALTRTWIWELKELGGITRKADREALKAWLTLETIRLRPPYGRYEIVKPALTSFIATVNNEAGFLNDPTGSRRYMTATITNMDWNYSRDVDPGQLWAQAKVLYDAGEDWNLTPDEAALIEVVNDEYEIIPPVWDWLDRNVEDSPGNFIPADEILKSIKVEGYGGSDVGISKDIATWMSDHHYERVRSRIDVMRNGVKMRKMMRGFVGVKL